MAPEHPIVHLFPCVIVIPIHEAYVGHVVEDRPGNDAFGIVVVVRRRAKPEIHVAPHHRFETILITDPDHLAKVAVEQFETVLISMFVKIFPQADIVRLIHANMNSFRPERLTDQPDCGLD
jgi:hypothetical protein